jgi:hypothetical protein
MPLHHPRGTEEGVASGLKAPVGPTRPSPDVGVSHLTIILRYSAECVEGEFSEGGMQDAA